VTRPEAAPGRGRLAARPRRPAPVTLEDHLVLGAVGTAPGTARGMLTATLRAWGLGHLRDPAEAIASELVTNAVTASAAKAGGDAAPAPVTFWVTAGGGELVIGAWDPHPEPPPPPARPGALAESGRGLLIVAALSSRWGCQPCRGGKHVWAAIPLAAPPG
jgi:hypothetical protein